MGTTHFDSNGIRIHNGDCLQVMRELPECSVDSIVTDPPYSLEFMGRDWDKAIPGVEVWGQALRVAKPGAHLLAFGGTRTYHRLACAIEDAGWEIRDCIMWVYGSGFPKSMNVQQAMNKAARGCPQGGADPESPNHGKFKGGCSSDNPAGRGFGAGAAAFMAEQGQGRKDDDGPWQGWGTALKPSYEPIIVARKPLIGTVAQNVLTHGTGAINVDGCRVPISLADAESIESQVTGFAGTRSIGGNGKYSGGNTTDRTEYDASKGRFPANLIHDGSDEVTALFPETTSGKMKAGTQRAAQDEPGTYGGNATENGTIGDSGSAARFFYCSKADSSERRGSKHPTVKPLDLMRYLVRLVTPVGATVLDPFMGSGTTLEAAQLEHCKAIGIEQNEEYCRDATKRLDQPSLFV